MSTSAAESAVTGDDAGNSFHLEWSNHLPNMQAVLEALYCHQSLVDVTLACSDGILKAHKVILSACSPYFDELFRDVPCKHPVLVLRGVSVREMRALLRYMYRGQVDVPEQELSALFATACEFKVKGFAGDAMKASGAPSESKLRPSSEDEDEEDEDDNEMEVDPLMMASVANSPATVGPLCSPTGSQTSQTEGEQASGADQEEAPPAAPLQPPPEDSLPSTSSVEPPAPLAPAPHLLGLLSLKQESRAEPEEEAAAEPVVSPSDTSCDPAPASTLEDPSAAAGDAPPAASTSCDPPPAPEPPIPSPSFRRETRFKGQKSVDRGLHPTIHTRSQDKRNDSACFFTATATTTPQASPVPPAPGPPPAKKFRSSGVVLTPVPVSSGPAALPAQAQDGHIVVGNETLILPSELMVKVKEEVESAGEEEEREGKEETATADMFCIPHLSPDSDMREQETRLGRGPWPLPTQCSSVQRPFNAPTDMAFPSVQRPVRQHKGSKPHVCEFCNLGFARASRLERHRRIHTGERPFCCPIINCERSFSRQDKLKLHMQRTHPWSS